MPLDTALYFAGTDKIYGVMGPYIRKFNATTGAQEAIQKINAPSEGPCGICALGAFLYVSVWNAQRGQAEWIDATQPLRDIFPVDPATLAIGAGLGVTTIAANDLFMHGPKDLLTVGNKIYYVFAQDGRDPWVGRVDPTLPGGNQIGLGMPFLAHGQMATDGTYLYYAYGFGPGFARFTLANVLMNTWDNCTLAGGDTGLVMPYAAEWCPTNSRSYYVGGNQWLCRVNSWGASDYTRYNLDAITAGNTPFHIRYRSSDGLLYIPSQGNDTVIVWNPTLGSGIAKTGFDGPIDVVYTPTKAFAVQSGQTSLVEIT